MSRIYEAATNKTTGAAAAPIALISTGTRRASILEIGVFATTAVAGEVGIGRPANTPATPTSVTVQASDPADEAGTTLLSNAWVTAPTVPGTAMRRIQLPATIGAGVIWSWAPGELMVPAASLAAGIVIWQFTAAAVGYDVYVKVLE